MRRISVYIINILISLGPFTLQGQDQPADSVIIPLKIRTAFEVTGPVIYFTNKNNLTLEGNVSADINERISIFLGTGFAKYRYSQYNYNSLENGIFFKTGVDFNFLKPEINMGKYAAGLGIHYGLSIYTSETPSFTQENYWGISTSSIPSNSSIGHFLEISPGFRAELFSNISFGWCISLRKLIYSGTSKDLMPIFIPGYGGGGKPTSIALNYFISFNIPYKKIKVAIKKEKPPEPEETEESSTTSTGIR